MTLVPENADRELDARKLNCPLPLLKAKQALHGMDVGQTLRVLATDPGSIRDFKAWTELSGHALLSFIERDHTFIYLVQKSRA